MGKAIKPDVPPKLRIQSVDIVSLESTFTFFYDFIASTAKQG
ncbi:MAG: hypothetical protein ABR555_01875 [Pyrinomonadaceae bacterium]